MNVDELAGKWKQLSGALKARWGKLTDDELTEISGNTQVLAGKLQEHYGRSKEEIRKEIDDFLANN